MDSVITSAGTIVAGDNEDRVERLVVRCGRPAGETSVVGDCDKA